MFHNLGADKEKARSAVLLYAQLLVIPGAGPGECSLYSDDKDDRRIF